MKISSGFIAGVIFGAMLGNLIGSTVYYNILDENLDEIRTAFTSGVYTSGGGIPEEHGSMGCMAPEIIFDLAGPSVPIRGICSGGVLAWRDSYLSNNHVLSFGPWRMDQTWMPPSARSYRTFQLYFKYWT